jgi:serine/threonine protein kinase
MTHCSVAPELITHSPYTSAVDIWSLGVFAHILFVFTRKSEWVNESVNERESVYVLHAVLCRVYLVATRCCCVLDVFLRLIHALLLCSASA